MSSVLTISIAMTVISIFIPVLNVHCQNHCVVVSGRAGLLGLAISLVSTVPERVWYVKAKGYKPWLKPKPQDVKHNDEGGHTIWYNEPELLQVLLSPTASTVLYSAVGKRLPCVEDPQ